MFLGIPTLLNGEAIKQSYKGILENLKTEDVFLILDNGNQNLGLLEYKVIIEKSERNLGVAGSWNWLAKKAFSMGFQEIVLLQDDVIWEQHQLEACRELIKTSNIDHLLSYLEYSVQVLRKTTFDEVGEFDESFFPAFYEDDDYSYRMNNAKKSYKRFKKLDPSPGSKKAVTSAKMAVVKNSFNVFVKKWGFKPKRPVNHPKYRYYEDNLELVTK